jgi:hypothetical protein
MTSNRRALVIALGIGGLAFLVAFVATPPYTPPMGAATSGVEWQLRDALILALIVGGIAFVVLRLATR